MMSEGYICIQPVTYFQNLHLMHNLFLFLTQGHFIFYTGVESSQDICDGDR